MASNQLSAVIRADILQSLVLATFKERKEKLVALNNEIAELAWKRYVGSHNDVLKTLPKHLVKRASSIALSIINSDGNGIEPCHDHFNFADGVSRICWIGCDNVWNTMALARNDSIGKKVVKYVKESSAIKEDIRSFNVKVEGALKSYRSLSKLVKDWPEIEKHVPVYATSTAGKELAINIPDLNSYIEGVKKAA